MQPSLKSKRHRERIPPAHSLLRNKVWIWATAFVLFLSNCGLGEGRYTRVWDYYGPRFGASFEAGEGVGWDRNFGAVEAFVPIIGAPKRSLIFSELRWMSTDVDEIGVNAGFGFRRRLDALDRTLGVLVHFDHRQVDRFEFDQLALGLEVLGPWDLRANAYLPRLFSDNQSVDSQFVGNFLVLDQGAAALSGFDVEIGKELPVGDWLPRVSTGVYHYDDQAIADVSIPNTTGIRTRVGLSPTACSDLSASVQHDSLFDTTFSFRFAMSFGPGRASRRYAGPNRAKRDRLADPIQRQVNVAVVENPGVVANDPSSGQPLQFLHATVSSVSGDGSFERPYNSLEELIADPRFSAGGVIAYVRGVDTAVANLQIPQHFGNISLAPNTQLLSNRPAQFASTQRGTRQLPFSGATSALLPSIVGDINLANDTRVSGFEVQGVVRGSSISRYIIEDNVLSALAISSPVIELAGVSGAGSILRNEFVGTISVAGASFEGDIADNVGTSSIDVNVTNFTGDIARNQRSSTNSGGTPVIDDLSLSVTADSFTGNVASNRLNGGSGLQLFVTNFAGSILDNEVTASTIDGVSATFDSFNGQIGRNTVNQNSSIGFNLFASDFSGTIFDNIANLNDSEAMRIEIAGAGPSSLSITNNRFSGNNFFTGTEFEATNSGTGAVTLLLSGNSSDTTAIGGFNFDLLNSGGGTFGVSPTGVNSVNTGTVGSSDGSVVIP